MNTQSQAAGLSPANPKPNAEYKDYVIRRDMEGPLTFTGVQLAKATRQSSGILNAIIGETVEAAVYKTRGGKFITSLSKTRQAGMITSVVGTIAEDDSGPDGGYNKAAVHETFEAAMEWFRPGRLTDEIRRQLGLDNPVHID